MLARKSLIQTCGTTNGAELVISKEVRIFICNLQTLYLSLDAFVTFFDTNSSIPLLLASHYTNNEFNFKIPKGIALLRRLLNHTCQNVYLRMHFQLLETSIIDKVAYPGQFLFIFLKYSAEIFSETGIDRTFISLVVGG